MQLVEIGLVFLEGLALIVSPCILPVLPLVLSASISGGRKRPFGIIVGFVFAFTVFAFLARKLVMVLHINLDYIQYGSLFLLALFGLILLSEKLSAIFSHLTQGFAAMGSSLSNNGREGFSSGIYIGMLIGLVWTPCAGPILAAVLVQIIRQQSDFLAILQVFAFALGVGIPMLLIALTGKQILNRARFFTTHAEAVRKFFGIIIPLSVAFIASEIDVQNLFRKPSESSFASSRGLEDALPMPYPAPEFAGIDTWLNSNPLTMTALRGKVVLVDFWTYSCINCLRTLPWLTNWYQKYRDKGLVIIGVHSPEFEFEKNKPNVEAAIKAHRITYPVAMDNNLDTWTQFKNSYWPAHYLINQKGQVVYTHFGEGDYAITENNIRALLGLNPHMNMPAETAPISLNQTPETYLGYDRSERFASTVAQEKDNVTEYEFPENLALNDWALQGPWLVENQRIIAKSANAKLKIHFMAGKVFLVMGTQSGKPVKASLLLNGKPLGDLAGKDTVNGVVTVNRHDLFELVRQTSVQAGVLEIIANEPGLEAYAFTFGK